MKRALVTGGAGFIGHHLVARLLHEGADVVVLDNLRRGSFERPELRGATLIEGDVRDAETCALAARGCHTVFHLAAQSTVMGAEGDPEDAFGTNVRGTWLVAVAAINAGVERLVFASSREVYGEQHRLPVDEGRAPSAKNVYGATKIAGEALLNAFGAALPVVALRFSNVIGTGDSGRVVPAWIAAARDGRALTLFGGAQVLDLVPVEFAVEAMLRCVRGPLPGGPINVGTGVGTTLRELAAAIVEATGSHSRVCQQPARGAEVTRFIADTARLRRELRLAPPTDALACLPAIVQSVHA